MGGCRRGGGGYDFEDYVQVLENVLWLQVASFG